ncbi:MAG: hypothetical protein CMF49_09420 [Legionellales bacterium]|nr:hypothetical protein [Legionellales bacterium]|tara:strand:- start:433 stop:2868 length:2436 start_codon:yes stop_codon:yes gene_type:complete
MDRQVTIRVEKSSKYLNDNDGALDVNLKKNILKEAGLSEDTNVALEIYDDEAKIDFSKHYKERLGAIEGAVGFIIKAEMPSKDNLQNSDYKKSRISALKKQVQWAIENAKQRITALKENGQSKSPDIYYNNILQIIAGLLADYLYPHDPHKKIDFNYITKLIDFAECCDLMTQPRSIECTIIENDSSNDYCIISNPLASFDNDDDFKKIPEYLNDTEKKYYQHALDLVKNKNLTYEDITTSSRHDRIEGARNVRETSSYTITKNKSLENLTHINNTAIIGSRSQEANESKTTAEYNFKINVERAVKTFLKKNPKWDETKPIPILYLTLITPIPVLKQDDLKLYKEKIEAIKRYMKNNQNVTLDGQEYKFTFHEANFAINHGQLLLPTSNPFDNYKKCLDIVKFVEQISQDNFSEEKKHLLKNAIKKFEKALETPYLENLTKPRYNRELYLASLLHIIFDEIGIVFGGCISAKDRAAIETIHTDAMRLTYKEKNEFPSFQIEEKDETRKTFVSHAVKIYCSGHHQKLSAQNANGVEAIKTPDRYLPTDIVEAIKAHYNDKRHFKKANRLASSNDTHKKLANPRAVPQLSQIARAYQALNKLNSEDAKTTSSDISEDAKTTSGYISVKALFEFFYFLHMDIIHNEYPVSTGGGRYVNLANIFSGDVKSINKKIRVPEHISQAYNALAGLFFPKNVSSEPKNVSSEPKNVSSESKNVSSESKTVSPEQKCINRLQAIFNLYPKSQPNTTIGQTTRQHSSPQNSTFYTTRKEKTQKEYKFLRSLLDNPGFFAPNKKHSQNSPNEDNTFVTKKKYT